jgi:hypothetical protein
MLDIIHDWELWRMQAGEKPFGIERGYERVKRVRTRFD